MPTRRAVLAAAGGLLAGCSNPVGNTVVQPGKRLEGLELDTPAFDDGATIPDRFTCVGADVSPPLRLEVPGEVAATALVVDDIDAYGFTHWTLYNVPPSRTEIPEGVGNDPTVLGGALQGTNGFGDVGYGGPCPPEDSDPHTYRFTLHGLERTLDLEGGAAPDDATDAIADASMGVASFSGEFARG